MPYTKAKERFFPSPAAGHARGHRAARRRSATCSRRSGGPATPAAGPDRVARRSAQPWCGGTWAPQPGLARRPRRPSRARLGVALVAGGLGQHVAEDRGQPAPALPVGLAGHAPRPASRHASGPRPSACSSRPARRRCRVGEPVEADADGEPPSWRRRRLSEPGTLPALITSVASRLVSGSSLTILLPDLLGLRRSRRAGWGRSGRPCSGS